MTQIAHTSMKRGIAVFACVGLSATALYAFLTWLFIDALRWPPMISSAGAYCCSAAWSYAGHRWLTFMSKGSPKTEAPRFALLTMTGLLVSAAIMKAITIAHLPSLLGIALVVAFIPCANYVILRFWVFNQTRAA